MHLSQGEHLGTGDLGVHELFELSSPSGSLVGFSVKGELASGKACKELQQV